MIDVQISGTAGFYAIEPITQRGLVWIADHVRGRTTWKNGALMCDDAVLCRNLVRAMDRAGLSITVNGRDMKGFGGKS